MIRVSARLGALAVALPLALGVAACGGSGGGGSSSDSAKSLRVLDYYSNEPDKTVYTKVLDACGKANGVTIKREAVPGDTLIQKVLQQSSSKTLPDVLMLDNPDLQQIAATGALAPLDEFGLSADGYAKGVVDASTYKGKLYGLQPITNTIALFYNKDILSKAGVDPPKTWDELRAAAKQLTKGKQYGIGFSAPANYEGTWQFLPFMWSNGGDEKNIATAADRRGAAAARRPGQGRLGVEVGAELVAGRRQRPVQGRQRGDDDQRARGSSRCSTPRSRCITGSSPHPRPSRARPLSRRSAARRGRCRRPATRRVRRRPRRSSPA